jgi:dimethylargininase
MQDCAMFRHAIARLPGANLADGLTRVDLGTPQLDLALAQHADYCAALRGCGLEVEVLPALADHPDACFVEDCAIVLPEGAILTRPGAPSRAGEVVSLESAVRAHFPVLERIEAPGTLDGGDICVAGRQVFIGISQRTNDEGAVQLERWLDARGYSHARIDIRGLDAILHLKSGLSALAGGRLLLIEALASHPAFAAYERVVVAAAEAYGANAVQVNDRVLVAAGHPQLEAQLQALGYAPLVLAMSEYAKLDGGLSCLSLRF